MYCAKKYNKRNSHSIYYDNNNDNNWIEDIATLMTCPQNKGKTNLPVALVAFLAMVASSCLACPVALAM